MYEKRKEYFKIKDKCPTRKEKHRERNAKYRSKQETKDLMRLRRGIKNPEIVPELLILQNNKCAICDTVAWDGSGPCADHDHISGKMRGMLCNACNAGLGMFKDNPRILAAAFEYILNPPACRLAGGAT